MDFGFRNNLDYISLRIGLPQFCFPGQYARLSGFFHLYLTGLVVAGDWQNGKPWQATYVDGWGTELGRYIDRIWYAN